MQKDDKALVCISMAGHGQLVKILITLDPHICCLLINLKVRLALVYQIKLKNNRQQENNALNNLFFHKSEEH